MTLERIKVIVFDADDTLWDNGSVFKQAESDMCRILSAYGDPQSISESLYRTEVANMKYYGYGAIAYTLSLVENAISYTKGKVTANELMQIIDLGKSILDMASTPLPGVREVLHSIAASGAYSLVIFTKGEIITQENKLKRSGLEKYFDRVVISSEKTVKEIQEICDYAHIEAKELLVVGNSLKSDMKPALDAGAKGIYIPFGQMWAYENIEEFTHENMIKLESISELPALLGI